MLNRPQKTLKEPVSLSGIGLHTGQNCKLKINPAADNNGVSFFRTDVGNIIKANVGNVVETNRGTVLEQKGTRVHTVEHLLSALSGLEIDNALIELNGPEPPILDGSALPFVEAIKFVGIIPQLKPKNYLEIKETIRYKDSANDIELTVLPYKGFKITFFMDYGLKEFGLQYSSTEDVYLEYKDSIAPARTFGMLSEISYLLRNNLIKGGNLDNSVVFVDRGIDTKEKKLLLDKFGKTIKMDLKKGSILNTDGLRFDNEPVRHKVLDLIGDLALLGRPIHGHVIAKKSGHGANIELVKELRNCQ